MKEEDVPQKSGLSDQWHRIAYATGKSGEYVLVESDGCDAVNITNNQAWRVIQERMTDVYHQVEQGALSPLAFYMELKQMDEDLLSQYSSFFKWQVKRHMKPEIFNRLSDNKLQKYADIFEVSIDDLKNLPDLEKVMTQPAIL